ncbi:MAG: glycerate kinase [Lentihominibacter sp.]
MKIIVIPDSFKGTLSSLEVCDAIRQSLAGHKVITIPAADGGEGTLDAFYHAKAAIPHLAARFVSAPAVNGAGEEISAPYLIAGTTAVIETAKVAGFVNDAPAGDGSFVMKATTYGVGMLMKDAIGRGARKIIVGLGGSCTNDGGCGMAAALGTSFTGSSGARFTPAGGTLREISFIDNSQTIRLLAGDSSVFRSGIDIVGMCDVTNPLLGPEGAAHVFAPQKGASPEEVDILETGLANLVSIIGDDSVIGTVTGSTLNSVGSMIPGPGSAMKLANLPGSGAAGGMGFGIRALLGGRLERGIDLLLDTISFDDLLWDADLVITGEGRFDSQSLGGKAVSGICARARDAGVPVILIAGTAKAEPQELKELGIIKCFEAGSLDFSLPPEEIKKAALANLQRAARKLDEYLNH